jgi:hypothetical protein
MFILSFLLFKIETSSLNPWGGVELFLFLHRTRYCENYAFNKSESTMPWPSSTETSSRLCTGCGKVRTPCPQSVSLWFLLYTNPILSCPLGRWSAWALPTSPRDKLAELGQVISLCLEELCAIWREKEESGLFPCSSLPPTCPESYDILLIFKVTLLCACPRDFTEPRIPLKQRKSSCRALGTTLVRLSRESCPSWGTSLPHPGFSSIFLAWFLAL